MRVLTLQNHEMHDHVTDVGETPPILVQDVHMALQTSLSPSPGRTIKPTLICHTQSMLWKNSMPMFTSRGRPRILRKSPSFVKGVNPHTNAPPPQCVNSKQGRGSIYNNYGWPDTICPLWKKFITKTTYNLLKATDEQLWQCLENTQCEIFLFHIQILQLLTGPFYPNL